MAALLKERFNTKLGFIRKFSGCCPIGIDISDNMLQVAQLAGNSRTVTLIAGSSRKLPENITTASAQWQRWVIETLGEIITNGGFHGRAAVASIPASQAFIDHIRIPAQKTIPDDKKQKDNENARLYQVALSKVKQKLPFDADEALIKYIPTENDNAIIIATQRKTIDRHLAIFERTNLQINSIAVWPMAITNTYVKFFGRRKTDIDSVVMLLDIKEDLTNVVICRHNRMLFARSLSIGMKQLNRLGQSDNFGQPLCNDELAARLILELTGCKRQFGSIYKKAQIERLIFLCGQVANKEICTLIAKQLELPAQMADCLAAIDIQEHNGNIGIDRRSNRLNWATAFGLSLS